MKHLILSLRNSDANRYNDELFKKYHFPIVYKSLIETGDTFVYYFSDTETNEKKFIGYGEVGLIIQVDRDNYEANLTNCYELIPSVPFKLNNKDIKYVELIGETNKSKKYPAFQRSIRKLNLEAYEYILNYTNFKKKVINYIDFDIPEFLEDFKEQLSIEEVQAYKNVNQINESNNRIPSIMIRENGMRVYARDSMLVKTVLVNSDFKCAISNKHITFQSKDDHQYSEGHHLIPMKYQYLYPTLNLDHTDNIFSLCPICHNAIHYGSQIEKQSRLRILYENDKFKEFIKKIDGINNFEDFSNKFY